MFSDTITLFNRYHSNTTGDTWYPHVLHNVNLNTDKANIVATYGQESTDSAKLIVHYKEISIDDNKAIVIEDLPFMPPKEWSKQTNDKLADSITFNDDAQLFDFFVVGDLGYNEPILDEDYKKGFYNVMNNKFDYCYAITSVGGPYKIIPHFELLAK